MVVVGFLGTGDAIGGDGGRDTFLCLVFCLIGHGASNFSTYDFLFFAKGAGFSAIFFGFVTGAGS